MAFVEPKYSKNQINKAGDILAAPASYSVFDQQWADDVLTSWRACHGYPNYFLDTQEFVVQVERVISQVHSREAGRTVQRTAASHSDQETNQTTLAPGSRR